MNYEPPKGPTNINDPKSPGLHGDIHGQGQRHGPIREIAHRGIGPTDHGNKGSQR